MISLSLIEVKKPVFLKIRELKNYLRVLIELEGFQPGDVSIVFCCDAYLLKVNQDFLQHDYYTDIITFDYCENGIINGDLIVSLDRVLANSEIEKVSFEEELYRVVFHGALHLCGYKDKTKNDIILMRSRESHYLNRFVSRETV